MLAWRCRPHRLRLATLVPPVCGTHVQASETIPPNRRKAHPAAGVGRRAAAWWVIRGDQHGEQLAPASPAPLLARSRSRRVPPQSNGCFRSMKGRRWHHPSGGDIGGMIRLQHESHGKVAADGLGRCQGHWRTIASCSGSVITAPVLVCGLMRWSGGTRGA